MSSVDKTNLEKAQDKLKEIQKRYAKLAKENPTALDALSADKIIGFEYCLRIIEGKEE